MDVRDNYLNLRIPPIANKGLTPIHRIRIPENSVIREFKDENINMFNLNYTVSVKVSEHIDEAILQNLYSIAKEQGVNELLIIDKEFVITALKNEVKRRNRC